MSSKYQELKEKWDFGYIRIDILRGWVVVNEKKPGYGITEEEFEQITGSIVK